MFYLSLGNGLFSCISNSFQTLILLFNLTNFVLFITICKERLLTWGLFINQLHLKAKRVFDVNISYHVLLTCFPFTP